MVTALNNTTPDAVPPRGGWHLRSAFATAKARRGRRQPLLYQEPSRRDHFVVAARDAFDPMKTHGPRSSMRAAWSGTIIPRTNVRCLFLFVTNKLRRQQQCLRLGGAGMTNAEKTSNDFRCPERARISWGKAMRGRGPGEGPNLSALGVAALRCALLKQVQPGMRVQTSAITEIAAHYGADTSKATPIEQQRGGYTAQHAHDD